MTVVLHVGVCMSIDTKDYMPFPYSLYIYTQMFDFGITSLQKQQQQQHSVYVDDCFCCVF